MDELEDRGLVGPDVPDREEKFNGYDIFLKSHLAKKENVKLLSLMAIGQKLEEARNRKGISLREASGAQKFAEIT